MGDPAFGTQLHEKTPEDQLDSWKEIAAYLGRDVTTVQRWEKSRGDARASPRARQAQLRVRVNFGA